MRNRGNAPKSLKEAMAKDILWFIMELEKMFSDDLVAPKSKKKLTRLSDLQEEAVELARKSK